MKNLGVGCHLDQLFVGAVCYAPSPSALRLMLHHCENFAVSRGLTFNAATPQLICFGFQPSHSCSAIIRFSDVLLPFCDIDADILSKAWDLVRKAYLMLYTFSAADPVVKSCLLQSYCLSLYSCSHWNLHVLPFIQLKSPLTSSGVSGTFHETVTPVFSTSLPASVVYSISFYLVHRHFCHLPYPVHPWLSIRCFKTEAG